MAPNTLHITVESGAEFHERVLADLEAIERGEELDDKYSVSLPDEAALSKLLRPNNVQLIRAIAAHEPDSMRETARLVDRDIKDVSQNLNELAELGLIEFERDGRAKRPVVWYNDIEIEIGIPQSAGSSDPEPVTG